MSSITMSSPTKSYPTASFSRNVDFRSRLDRAKYQYENLLLHAGSNLLVEESPANSHSAPSATYSASQMLGSSTGFHKALPLSASKITEFPAPSAGPHHEDFPLPMEGKTTPLLH